MKKKLLSLFSLLIGFFGFSQTEVYFKFDESGNQRYRGINNSARKSELSSVTKLTKEPDILPKSLVIDEKDFWKQIRLYPVPVNDILTIDWSENVDQLIESVSIYQQSTVHWKFQQQNIPQLNKQLQVNMSGYYFGVYILRFTLKDGRVFNRNITKR